jgi:hypothetical protein
MYGVKEGQAASSFGKLLEEELSDSKSESESSSELSIEENLCPGSRFKSGFTLDLVFWASSLNSCRLVELDIGGIAGYAIELWLGFLGEWLSEALVGRFAVVESPGKRGS